MRAAVEQAIEPRAKLEALVDTIIRYFDDNPHVFDLIQHAEALQRPNRRLPWKARAVSFEVTTAVILEGQRAGLFRVEDPTLAMLMLLGGLRAVFRLAQSRDRQTWPSVSSRDFCAAWRPPTPAFLPRKPTVAARRCPPSEFTPRPRFLADTAR